MAKADIEVGFILKLTEDEAQTLMDILINIAGHPGTRREHADAIYEALADTGLEPTYGATDVIGEIEFEEKQA